MSSFDEQTYHQSHSVKQILSTARHSMVQFAINKITVRRSKKIKQRTVILNVVTLNAHVEYVEWKAYTEGLFFQLRVFTRSTTHT